MCQFFSLVSNGDGKPLYFDYKIRKQIIAGKLSYGTDSHTSIADYFGFKGEKEDTLNKYEYNPLTKVFTVDQKNNPKDDSAKIEKFCKQLDFKTIVPELIIKPIIHPFKDRAILKATPQDLKMLKQWASVRDNVRVSMWASMRDNVGASVRASMWAYYSTFFDIKYKHDFSSAVNAVKLWEKGIVPSYDGKIWRLHGKDGKVIWSGKIKDIK